MRALPSAGHSSRVPGWRQDWEQNVQKNSLICFESIPLVGPQFSQPGREGMGCVCWGSPPPLRGPHCPPAMVWGIRGLLGSEQSPPNPQPPEGAKLGQNRGSEAPPPGPPPLCVDPAGPGGSCPGPSRPPLPAWVLSSAPLTERLDMAPCGAMTCPFYGYIAHLPWAQRKACHVSPKLRRTGVPSAPSVGSRQARSNQAEEADPVHTWCGVLPRADTVAPRPRPGPRPDPRLGKTRPADQSSDQRPPVGA